MSRNLRIATRQSPLALWQAHHVRKLLEDQHPALHVDLVPMTTRGDQMLASPLSKVGGKGLFVKELEQALLDGRADIAVHSMKDVPMDFPAGLGLGAICAREDPSDALVSSRYVALTDLPPGSLVGTSSLRRQCQIRNQYPQIRVVDLRGNVNTRLARLDRGDYDVIVLATAGLLRLGMSERIAARLTPEESLPAAGQGAVGIECRLDDHRVQELLGPLNHKDTLDCVTAERAMNRRLQGGCQVPIACYAQLTEEGNMQVRGLVGSPDGSKIIRDQVSGPRADAEQLGNRLAEKLLEAGAGRILEQLYKNTSETT